MRKTIFDFIYYKAEIADAYLKQFFVLTALISFAGVFVRTVFINL